MLLGVHFRSDVDIGNLLTGVALVAGFLWWAWTTARARYRSSEEEAKSGALRLLLKLLRDAPDERMDLQELFNRFQSDDLAKQRKDYCGKTWRYQSYDKFEGAVYRLHWESKIDFVSGARIAFRTERRFRSDGWKRFSPSTDDAREVITSFDAAMADPAGNVFALSELAEAAMILNPEGCSKILRLHLAGSDANLRRRAAALVAHLIPRDATA